MPFSQYSPVVRRVEAADEVHERRLAGARRTHDGHVLVAPNREVDAAQRAHDFATHVVLALETTRDDHPVLARCRARRIDNRFALGGGAERVFAGSGERLINALARRIWGHDLVTCGFLSSFLGSRTSAPSFSSRIAW